MPKPKKNPDLKQYEDRRGLWSTLRGDVTIPVVVKYARSMYGRVELLVTPINGTGETWANVLNVKLEPKEAR